jgi:hypothetical protein
MAGLQRTRKYRALTYWFRAKSRFISRFTFDPLESLAVKFGLISTRQKTLFWTKDCTHKPPPRLQLDGPVLQHVTSPSIELTLLPHETPAMAHSHFPPAHTTRRTRNESDASLPIYEQYRTSEDSNWPLIQLPSDIHRSRASRSQDRRRSSELSDTQVSGEYLLSPEILLPEHHIFGGWPTVQSRQGYRRANSDPGNTPDELVREVESGLGIGLDETLAKR